jgi:hypothetical protein
LRGFTENLKEFESLGTFEAVVPFPG